MNKFNEGEIIYDVDGNEYIVRNNKAVLNKEGSTVSYYLGKQMETCFARTKPVKEESGFVHF